MNIIWLSRHEPTAEQEKKLRSIISFDKLIVVSKTISRSSEIKSLMSENEASEIVAVLPINLVSDLINREQIKPIRAVMNRQLDENGEATFIFSHFERVLSVAVETEKME